MRDDDDLPVLSAVVRSGDADAIRSARLDSARTGGARAPRATVRSRLARAAAFETDDVARIDLGHGAIDIDATRDRAGARASRRLADVRVALAREVAVLGRVRASGDGDRLDDTLPLDDEVPATAPVGRHRHVVPVASGHAARGAVSADLLEDLVDEIVDRHVAALRRDVRDALARALDAVDG